MSVTTTLATVVQRQDGFFGSLTPPASGGPPIPTGKYDDLPQDDPHQITTSGAIAIACSSLSLFLAVFTIYWFIRMRRRFRHNLIMLLIAGNIWRSLWRLLFPLVEYIKYGIFPTESAFCQASGFFTSQGIEAVDCSILLIAIHSSLSVFSRNPGHRKGGLYPYRWWAYAFWALFPILIAALAYTNPNHKGGYSAQGSICYLPSRPYTFVNLSWVPRYVVAAVVLVVYPTIYMYATHKSHQYSKEIMGVGRMQTYEKSPWYSRILLWCESRKPDHPSQQQQNLMTAHEMRSFSRGFHLKRNRSDKSNQSQAPYGSQPYPLDSALELDTSGFEASAHHPRLPGGRFGFPTHELEQLSSQRTMQNKSQPQDLNLSDTGQDLPRPEPAKTRSDDLHALSSGDTRTTTTTSMTDAATSAAVDFAQDVAGTAEELGAAQREAPKGKRGDSGVGLPLYKKFRRLRSVRSRQSSSAHSLADSQASTISLTRSLSNASSMLSQMSLTDTQNDVPSIVATNEMRIQHERMRRQLRYLFLYPAAYILLYIPPFVSHILRSRQSYYSDPSYVLSAFVIISASIQAGVDCVLFSWIEKPWRHIPGSDGSFLGSFDCLSIRKRRRRGQVQDPADISERLAQQLRDLERSSQRTLEGELTDRPTIRPRRSSSRRPAQERYWWEQFEDDEDEVSTRRRSSRGNRRISFADGMGAFADEEDQRGRERRRRVSFPHEYGSELEREIPLPRSESYPSDARSRSSRSSSNRRSVNIQAEAYPFGGRNESSKRRRNSSKVEAGDDEGAERFDDIPLHDDGQIKKDDERDEELPPEPRIVETDDHS